MQRRPSFWLPPPAPPTRLLCWLCDELTYRWVRYSRVTVCHWRTRTSSLADRSHASPSLFIFFFLCQSCNYLPRLVSQRAVAAGRPRSPPRNRCHTRGSAIRSRIITRSLIALNSSAALHVCAAVSVFFFFFNKGCDVLMIRQTFLFIYLSLTSKLHLIQSRSLRLKVCVRACARYNSVQLCYVWHSILHA